MLNKLLNNKLKIALTAFLVMLLACVRGFENQLFYDPFLNYFKADYNVLPFPEYDLLQLLLGILFRYALNTVLSLGIIYVLFREIGVIKFTAILYVFFFLFLIAAFFLTICIYDNHNNLLLFYIRRFLIQPIFVLLFIPAFYYQNRITKK